MSDSTSLHLPPTENNDNTNEDDNNIHRQQEDEEEQNHPPRLMRRSSSERNYNNRQYHHTFEQANNNNIIIHENNSNKTRPQPRRASSQRMINEHDYNLLPFRRRSSIISMGSRHVGRDVYAPIRKLEKKERSDRRLKLQKRRSASGAPSLMGEGIPLLLKLGSRGEDGSVKSIGGAMSGGGTGESFADEPANDDDDATTPPPDDPEGTEAIAKAQTEAESSALILRDMIFTKPINILLLFVPFALISHLRSWNPLFIFWFNFLSMIPLASILGDFTEEVAAHTNQVVGGLINATFGNAVEVVVGIQALLANEIRVVQSSMIGSIFSNLLLVLGGCFFFGGLKYDEQSFNSTAATANMSLLALCSVALVLPTPFANYYEIEDEHVLVVSRFAAVFLLFMYVQLLVFQLKTHKHLFVDEVEEEAELVFGVAMGGLCVVTLLIAVLSEYLVDSIDGFVTESGVSRTFVGLIILPIVGNAVEHMTAITVAMKNKMDLAMGVCVGSCTQISLFVIPLTVLAGWFLEKDMTLNFPHFEIILYVMSIIIVSICLSNPKGNWLEGSLLMTTYVMIAVGFWYEKVKDY